MNIRDSGWRGNVGAVHRTGSPTPHRASGKLYVQFGCGLSAPDGWINFDASPTLRLQRLPLVGGLLTRGRAQFPRNARYGDVVRGLPIPSGACQGVYASHILEHLSRRDFDLALAEAHRMLAPGGIFRLVVPDLAALVERYRKRLSMGELDANDKFLSECSLGLESRSRGLNGILAAAMGNSSHLWMWDEPSLKNALDAVGFTRVRRAQFNDCADPAFVLVEAEQRFVDAVAIEGVKQ